MTCRTCHGEGFLFQDCWSPRLVHYTVERPCEDCPTGDPDDEGGKAPAPPGGHLAAALFGAERTLLRAEHVLEALLDNLYGTGPSDWTSYNYGRAGCVIDVYGCIPSSAAAAALIRAGFGKVVAHDHSEEDFRMCACQSVIG